MTAFPLLLPASATAVTYFPFAEYLWFYVGFTLFVLLLLLMDLGVFNRKSHTISMPEAAGSVLVWMSLAMAFCFGLYRYSLWKFAHEARLLAVPGFEAAAAAKEVALEFLAGYVLEQSLSVDNMFVFVVVFGYFRIPSKYQHRVLFFGILGALVFRAVFIALGSALLQFQWTVYVFGGILLVTGVKLMFGGDGEVHPENNPMLKLLQRVMPVTPELHEKRFFVHEAGRWMATPLFVCLLFLELTDILFAVDSVPAIFGVTDEPLVVFTSNIFAILGLRSFFFLLAGAVHLFHLLKYGLAAVLIFVGLKMVWLNQMYHGHFPIVWSLGIILGLLGVSIALSLLFPRPKETHTHGA